MYILHDKFGNRKVITNEEAIEQGYYKIPTVILSEQFKKIQEKNKSNWKDFIGSCLLGILFAAMFVYGIPAKAQTYSITNSMGYSQGTVQINGNTAQFVNPMGYTTQTATIYPNQVVITTPNGYTTSVVGNTGYTVPPSPPTPSSPRVLQ
jgi:hypothetical protein